MVPKLALIISTRVIVKRIVLALILAACILQVQAVLLLLGGREVPPTMPAIPMTSHLNNRVCLT